MGENSAGLHCPLGVSLLIVLKIARLLAVGTI